MIEDQSTLESFIKIYLDDFRKTKDKLVLSRCSAGQNCYTLINPSLKLVKSQSNEHQFRPKMRVKALHVNNYYVYLIWHLGFVLGLNYKKTTYGASKYGEMKLPLQFEVINEISFFWADPDGKQDESEILINPSKFTKKRWRNFYVFADKEYTGRKSSYFFNVPWNTWLNTEIYRLSPHSIVTYYNTMSLDDHEQQFKIMSWSEHEAENLPKIRTWLVNWFDDVLVSCPSNSFT